MLKILSRFLFPQSSPPPEQAWQVWESGEVLHCAHEGRETTVSWAAVNEVAVETNDLGPYLPDVFWHFRGADHEIVFPQGAPGDQEVIDRTTRLPGFDHGALSRAMRSTENAWFVVWKK